MAITLALLDVVIVAILSAYWFDTNDNMYAAAPLIPGVLYRDNHFVQGPVAFYFLKALSFVIPTGLVYLGFRLASVGLLLAALFVGAFLCIDRWLSRCMFLVFAGANLHFIFAALEIGSYALPLFLLSLATATLWKVRDRRIAIAASALLIGLAASAKLNHVLFFLPLAAFVWLQRRPEESLSSWARAALLPFAVGGVIGSAPVILEFALHPAGFFLHTLVFHSKFSLNALDLPASVRTQFVVEFAGRWAFTGGAVLVALGIFAAISTGKDHERQRHFLVFVVLGIFAGLIAAISPGFTYIQYWAPMTFFSALGGARFFDQPRGALGLIAMVAALPIFALCLSQLSTNRDKTSTPKIAAVIDIHKQLEAYALRTGTRQCDKRIFSLAGAFVVDSGFRLSRYMEGGVFWTWVRSYVPQIYLADRIYHLDEYILFPERWVRDQRLNFLLLGFYPGPAETEMEKYAVERGFSKKVLPAWPDTTLEFYFNPDCID